MRTCAPVAFVLALATALWIAPPSARAAADDSAQEITRSAPHLQKADAVPTEAWTIAADTQLQSINLGDTSGSLGFGIGRQTKHSDAMVVIRKGTADSLQGSLGAPTFGQFVLTPAAAKIGLTVRAQGFLYGPYKCVKVPSGSAPEDAGGCGAGYTQASTLRPGILASLDLGVADFAPSDPTTMPPATSATALAATLGVVLRSETQFTVAGATNPVMGALYFGGTMRAVGGDLTPTLRTGFLGNDASTYWGIEFGGMFRIATLEVVGKATFLTHSGNDVAGLTGLHFVPTIAFRLPFDIVTQTAPKGQPSPSDAQKATAASTPAAAAAPAAPAAPTAPPPAATP